MERRDFLRLAGAGLIAGKRGQAAFSPRKSSLSPFSARNASRPLKPNIILFLGDDLGLADLGCYGGKLIRTPSADKLAAEGLRFTQCYSGSPVCAPSRCVLMTGLHSGHAYIRDNLETEPEGQEPLPAGTATLPGLLKAVGYRTGVIGKWGLGPPGSEGDPNKQGFDHFFGYNCQRHAHNHYPTFLWRNSEKIVLEGNDGGATGKVYAPDLFESEALQFIRNSKDGPFFLFFATTVPHLALQVPEDSLAEYNGLWPETPYDGKKGYRPHRTPRAAYAAMVTRFDRSVGRIMALIKELGIDGRTLVLLASDNGATYDVGGYDMDFFRATCGGRMHKGHVYEGGIRVPLIARWPGRITPGKMTSHICAFQDFLPTLLDVASASARVPRGLDGVSFRRVLEGRSAQVQHEHLYMEFPGYGGQQMVRLENWKGVRKNLLREPGSPIELYDLAVDPGETKDLAAQYPDIVRRLAGIMKAEHRPSKKFPFPALDKG